MEVKPRGYRLDHHQSTSLHVYSTAPDHGRAVSIVPIFVYLSLYSFHIVCLFYQNVFSQGFVFFLSFFRSLSSHPIPFLYFFFPNKQAQTEVGDRGSPDVTDLAEVWHP